jgi:hypothetical protein
MFTINDLFKLSKFIYNTGLIFKEKITLVKNIQVYKMINRNKKLVNYKTSDTCYICGNGPSLKKVNIDNLCGDLIVVNDYFRFGSEFIKRPTYYLILDDIYGQVGYEDRLKSLLESFTDVPLILPASLYRVTKEGIASEREIYYYCPWGKLFKAGQEIDFTKVVSRTWNVVSQAIVLAMSLGYKRIVLLGCDYNLFATNTLQHCYDSDDGTIRPNLLEMLYKYCFTTDIHYEIAKEASRRSIEIENATADSLLDAYPMSKREMY